MLWWGILTVIDSPPMWPSIPEGTLVYRCFPQNVEIFILYIKICSKWITWKRFSTGVKNSCWCGCRWRGLDQCSLFGMEIIHGKKKVLINCAARLAFSSSTSSFLFSFDKLCCKVSLFCHEDIQHSPINLIQ